MVQLIATFILGVVFGVVVFPIHKCSGRTWLRGHDWRKVGVFLYGGYARGNYRQCRCCGRREAKRYLGETAIVETNIDWDWVNHNK